jgi:hypothetical protein
VKLAEHNRVQLIWVLGKRGIEGNETANQVARLRSESPSIGTDKAVREWAMDKQRPQKSWASLAGLKHAEGFLQGPSARRTRELFKLKRNQLQWVSGLLTGHCQSKGHLFKMGLTNNPTCERCLEKDESATDVLCDCEATAYLRFRHL